MKKPSLSLLFICCLPLIQCGPAAESRENMYGRGKVISDSMADIIRSAMDEARLPSQNTNGNSDTVKMRLNSGAVPTSSNGC